MLNLSRPPHRFSKPTGLSLVEMMIAIVIGLVVVGGVIGIFASAIKSHSDNLKMTRLNQELRVTMNLMTRELRRAGFWGGAKTGEVNRDPNINVPAAGGCITFRYDENNNRTSEPTERRGFQLDGSAVDSGTDTGDGCAGSWSAITDPAAVVITGLTFTLTATPLDVDGVPGAVPCRPPPPRAFPECPPGANSIIPAPQTVPVQQIDITLTGRLAGDATVTRTLQGTVRVYQ